MSFVPLHEATAPAVMRAGLPNFIERMAQALAISLADTQKLARLILDERADDDNANEDAAS
jgi:hypothetical protein